MRQRLILTAVLVLALLWGLFSFIDFAPEPEPEPVQPYSVEAVRTIELPLADLPIELPPVLANLNGISIEVFRVVAYTVSAQEAGEEFLLAREADAVLIQATGNGEYHALALKGNLARLRQGVARAVNDMVPAFRPDHVREIGDYTVSYTATEG